MVKDTIQLGRIAHMIASGPSFKLCHIETLLLKLRKGRERPFKKCLLLHYFSTARACPRAQETARGGGERDPKFS